MIAVIDYGMGNLDSVCKALAFCGGSFELIGTPEKLDRFHGVLLPGVGHFGDGMENLRSRGFDRALQQWDAAGKPLGGICLGMQMMLESSEEAPGVSGLGLIRGRVRRFPSAGLKVPQIGWNSVVRTTPHPVTAHTADGEFFYFVHSYYAELADPAEMVLQCEYILPFAAAIGRKNLFATQFHPEKSQQAGLDLLRHFIGFCR